ncbi:MAG: hypothetical protein JNK02_17425 [Planctomycetes bacterium]|nr:hypothetical protein [Planctomycetota bacterium]
MTEAQTVHSVTPVTAEGAPRAQSTPPVSSIEFRALLDRLREHAASLERAADAPLGARELPGAVEQAGASLAEALKIAEGLLEAYRSSRVQADAARPTLPPA